MSQILVNGESRDIPDFIDIEKYDSLKAEWGNNKSIPEEFELQILIALTHYPELKNVKINFAVKKSFAPLSAMPFLPSLIPFYPERKYRIVISNSSTLEMERILLKNLPINAQIGVIGHELAHVVDYNQKSLTELIAVALNYGINPAYHAWFEKSTDLRTIEHGLGWELYDYSKYVRTIFGNEDLEVNLSDDFYLHYNEILLEMEKSELYNLYFQPNSRISNSSD